MKKRLVHLIALVAGVIFATKVNAQAPDGFMPHTGRQLTDSTEVVMVLESGATPINGTFIYWETPFVTAPQMDTVQFTTSTLQWNLVVSTKPGSQYEFKCILDNGYGQPTSHSGSFNALAATGVVTVAAEQQITVSSFTKTVTVKLPENLVGDIHITNLIGQQIAAVTAASGINRLDLIQKGFYLVSITDPSGKVIATKKVYVE